jgi:dTMP kinase
MTKTEGLFLCLEGGDGSGKGTQHQLLIEELQSAGEPLLQVDFPRYGQASAQPVEWLFNNEFGDPTRIDPRLASLPFAIDRQVASPEIKQALSVGKLVLANRFTASNMAHHGAKFSDQQQRIGFFNWLHDFEHDTMGIPEPDYHFVLHVPAAIARERILQKAARSYTAEKLDGLEADLEYQQRVEQTYLDLVKTFPDRFGLIECVEGTYEKTPQEIHGEIWSRVQELIHHE